MIGCGGRRRGLVEFAVAIIIAVLYDCENAPDQKERKEKISEESKAIMSFIFLLIGLLQ